MKINICFSSDNNYAKYLSVAIASIFENSNTLNEYIVYVLDGGISEINKRKIKSIEKENCKIEFLQFDRIIKDFDFKSLHVDGHVSIATYFRLFMPQIFNNLSKIIYLDCDVVCHYDIAELYSIDLEDNLVGAVSDIGLIYNNARNKIDKDYFKNVIKIEQISEYFNAGVILYNLAKFNKDEENKLFQIVNTIKKPKFHDQCYLNIFAKNRVKFLDFKWNYWGNFKADYFYYKDDFPKEYIDEFENASDNPYIIHSKPWLNPDNEWAEEFFKYAKMTPFYENIIYENIKKRKIKKEINILGLKIRYKI